MNESALRRLINDPPKLHSPRDFGRSGSEALVNWGIQTSLIKYLTTVVSADSYTLETGSGISTVCFALIGSHHICITPVHQEIERIDAYCKRDGISTERIQFIASPSQAYLPSLNLDMKKLDLGFIDGSHAFPIPMIDFYYINKNLKVGGLLVIDDLNIPSVGILHSFLLQSAAFELVRFDGAKTGIYRKTKETEYPNDWRDQQFNLMFPDFRYLPFPERVLAKVRWHWIVRKLHRFTQGRMHMGIL